MQGMPDPDADLATYYDRHAGLRNTRSLTPHRVEAREWFVRLLKREHRHSLMELGCGTGVEGLAFVQAGLHYTGVDLSPESVHVARAHGLDCSVANGRSLPFPDGAFDAAWSMSTLLHVPNSSIHDVVRELVRVTAAGAPIGVGLWSGDDEEVLNPEDLDEPRRFFSRRSDQTLQRIFGEHGSVEHFQTWPEGTGEESGPGAGNWAQHYQFLVLRTPSPKRTPAPK
ncbi:class I SAM-dependent methyltransferase [Paenarthrobacter ureafaciens]|jgi:SAM-dependent methyltransferase|uniref:class I SAM-dependent methyltransferase n=1 Tax=Paenarthrobacter ureafaciens TaxID=37931 RepID=UPI001C2BB3C8|nr:class I SAM-dependent methyltransferase [Paenarthrobacter ureafaciens]UOD82368.1 methyltransferase domain-containing protein [Paenarthrobacter ureafaciens]WNZ05865.1 class I SAM-dependent methyltransferase [Paenarthrobacter ureafaciens]